MTRASWTTLERAIKPGGLSATKLDDGSYQINPVELSRVRATVAETAATEKPMDNVVRHTNPDRDAGETPATPDVELLTRIAALEVELDGLKAMVKELKQSRDKWQMKADNRQQQAERATTALAAPGRPWWKRLAS